MTVTHMNMNDLPLVDDELELLAALVPLAGRELIELGCGDARLARALLEREPAARVAALEVDRRQHAKNLAAPHGERLRFILAGAESIPFADASFDGALMLKSLHHVPADSLDRALAEVARVLRPQGWLYVSEPVYAGPFNELLRRFHDEGAARAAAQAALDRALADGRFRPLAERRFATPVTFAGFDDFEARLMRPTYAEHRIDDAKLAEVRAAYAAHADAAGVARFVRPMHLRLVERG